MVRIKDDVFVYAEGGGDSDSLKSEFRQAFAAFFSKTILGNTRRPRVVACGGRDQAFDMFQTAISQGRNALLLVDSETEVFSKHQPPPDNNWRPWDHLKTQAGWEQPSGTTDDDCHLMAWCMESWFFADWDTVEDFFGQGFKKSVIPNGSIESFPKTTVYQCLQNATSKCKTKAPYGKGSHSFKLLALIDSNSVMNASPWAKRFIDELAKRKP